DPIVGRNLNSSVTQERSRVRCQKLERFLALLVEFLQDFAEFLVGQQFVHVTHELLEGCRPVMLFHGRLPLADRWLPFCRYPPPARNVRKMTCKERVVVGFSEDDIRQVIGGIAGFKAHYLPKTGEGTT